MVRDQCNYFSFWAIFWRFTSLTTWKIKILKKQKKHLEISLFYIFVPKIMITWSTVPEIWCVTDVIVISHFELFLPFYPSHSPKKTFLKKWKKRLEISSFYISVPKIMIRWCTVAEIWCVTNIIVFSHFGLFFALLPI